jgi:hypothetical protein
MNNSQLKKQVAMTKRVGCILRDCGQHFTFTINEHKRLATKGVSVGKAIWNGKCVKCYKALRLNENALLTFQSIYGSTNFNLTKSTFDTLFEVEEVKK